ncbi:hypothetical protein L1987_60640 [Smallanthus sonchifolius]|uniref:Uncharacterized protein n=1 Tax=Smallanthus sonchifolius TaxID=185202 RepID=A0ACB9D8Y2_9ASTR|nr:hypothetical protein L1987_60640 [Smallanthus sonchifolius]
MKTQLRQLRSRGLHTFPLLSSRRLLVGNLHLRFRAHKHIYRDRESQRGKLSSSDTPILTTIGDRFTSAKRVVNGGPHITGEDNVLFSSSCSPQQLPFLSLNHVSFNCSSVPTSVKFYNDVLGFVLITRPSSFDFEALDLDDIEDEIDEEVDKVLTAIASRTAAHLLEVVRKDRLKQPAYATEDVDDEGVDDEEELE